VVTASIWLWYGSIAQAGTGKRDYGMGD